MYACKLPTWNCMERPDAMGEPEKTLRLSTQHGMMLGFFTPTPPDNYSRAPGDDAISEILLVPRYISHGPQSIVICLLLPTAYRASCTHRYTATPHTNNSLMGNLCPFQVTAVLCCKQTDKDGALKLYWEQKKRTAFNDHVPLLFHQVRPEQP